MAAGTEPPLSFREIVQELSAAQKSGANAPAYTRYVNRWLGRRLAALSALVGLTPNQVTVISAITSWCGIAILATAGFTVWGAALGVMLLLAGYAWDAADGQLARLTNRGSPYGEWLDHVLDGAKIPGVHLAALTSLMLRRDGSLSVAELTTVLFTIVSSAYFLAFILTDQLRRRYGDGRKKSVVPDSRGGRWASVVLLPSDFGLLCITLLTLPWIGIFTWLYGLVFVLTSVFVTAALLRWRREMRALG